MTTFLRALGFVGLLLFGGLLILLTAEPDVFKRSALSFAKGEVSRAVMERYPDLAILPEQERVKEGLSRLSQRLGSQQTALEKLAASDFPERIGRLVEAFCSCGPPTDEGAAARAQAVRAYFEGRASALGLSQKSIEDFARSRYDATLAALRLDLLIFLSVNAAAFAAVLGATFVPRERRHAVIAPAALMAVSTVISASIYVFGTDWFYAILFRDYVGLWYAFGLLFVFGLLVDIVMNRARATLRILSNLPSGLSVPLC